MHRSTFVRSLAVAALLPRVASAQPVPAPSETPRPDPAIDRFFARAKRLWRERVDPPYVTYTIVESYDWHDRRQEHRWSATLRTNDRRLVLARVPDPPRNDADAFVVLDPPIVANDSFGFVEPARAAPSADGSGRPNGRRGGRLNEIARTEAFVRDYAMENVGIEPLHGVFVQHLLLVPRREPLTYRLRDLWVAVLDGTTAQLSVQGLFAEAPYDRARWLVQYRTIDGRPYVERVFNVEDLVIDGQTVRNLSFECLDYAFPAAVPEGTFTT